MSTDLKPKTTPLGDWVDELLTKTWFQPDDKVAQQSFLDGVAPDLAVRCTSPQPRSRGRTTHRWSRVNNDSFTYEQYRDIFQGARARDEMTVQANDELLAAEAPDPSGGGTVAHLSRWTGKDKVSGVETRWSTLTVANVQVRDGKRVLVGLTEVMKMEA